MRDIFLSVRKPLCLTISIFLTAAALLVSGSFEPSYAARTWELVYKADANGVATPGSLDALIAAIRSGAEVQIVSHGSYADGLFKPVSVKIEPDGNGGFIVAAYVSENSSNADKTQVIPRVMIFRSNGQREGIWPGQGIPNQLDQMPMEWYVNR